jgi:membrane-associated phospholipid phosphatase
MSQARIHGQQAAARKRIGQQMLEADAAALRGWWPERVAIAAAFEVIGWVILVSLGLYIAAHRTVTFPGDKGLLALVDSIHQPVIAGFINFSSYMNWPEPKGLATTTVVVVTLFLVIMGRYREAICTAVIPFVSDFTSFLLLNIWVQRPRPGNLNIHAVGGLGASSYPSGHVVHVTAFYGFLLYLALHEQRWFPAWKPWLRVVQVICGYFIVFIAISRLLEQDHWPSDVLAGYLLGAMMLVLGIAFYHWMALVWLHHQERRALAQGSPQR